MEAAPCPLAISFPRHGDISLNQCAASPPSLDSRLEATGDRNTKEKADPLWGRPF